MEIIDEPRYPTFDPKPFITYDGEEDTTPTAAELVEELPEYELPPAMKAIAEGKPLEKPLRRGIGYLRAETAPDVEETPAAAVAESDFGAGLAPESTRPTENRSRGPRPSNTSPGVGNRPTAESTTSAGSPNADVQSEGESSVGRKKRRRPRRRRGKGTGDHNLDTGSHTSATPIGQTSTGTQDNSATTESARDSGADLPVNSNSSAEKPKRNRRRRRRKRGGGDNTGDSSTPSTD